MGKVENFSPHNVKRKKEEKEKKEEKKSGGKEEKRKKRKRVKWKTSLLTHKVSLTSRDASSKTSTPPLLGHHLTIQNTNAK